MKYHQFSFTTIFSQLDWPHVGIYNAHTRTKINSRRSVLAPTDPRKPFNGYENTLPVMRAVVSFNHRHCPHCLKLRDVPKLTKCTSCPASRPAPLLPLFLSSSLSFLLFFFLFFFLLPFPSSTSSSSLFFPLLLSNWWSGNWTTQLILRCTHILSGCREASGTTLSPSLPSPPPPTGSVSGAGLQQAVVLFVRVLSCLSSAHTGRSQMEMYHLYSVEVCRVRKVKKRDLFWCSVNAFNKEKACLHLSNCICILNLCQSYLSFENSCEYFLHFIIILIPCRNFGLLNHICGRLHHPHDHFHPLLPMYAANVCLVWSVHLFGHVVTAMGNMVCFFQANHFVEHFR